MLSLRFSVYSAVESKAFRLREVFGPTGPIQRGTLRWADRLGSSHALITRGSRTSRRSWEQCSPFNANMECCLTLRLNLIAPAGISPRRRNPEEAL